MDDSNDWNANVQLAPERFLNDNKAWQLQTLATFPIK